MDQNRVFYTLISFKPLLSKLRDNCVDIDLTKEDKELMEKFIDLWTYGWLDSAKHYKKAGLFKSDINTLFHLAEKLEPGVMGSNIRKVVS